jgi:RNA polymerase sigma-70 factor (ECF subfamily)
MSFSTPPRHMRMTNGKSDLTQAPGTPMTDPDGVHSESTFTAVTSPYRRELLLYCYRMLGSLSDSEDMVQETFLRAWNRRETFQGRSSLRAWLYAIATNACLDFLEARQGRVLTADPAALAERRAAPPEHIPWLTPYPDRLLPDAAVVAKETIELAYVVAVQHLPPRQRAVLILCDVLDWSAKETADLLELSVAAVNSALQRARETLRAHAPARRPEARPRPEADARERALIDRYVSATERGDVQGLATLLREDLRWSMPPEPVAVAGRDQAIHAWVEGGFGSPALGSFRCTLTRANGMPAVANYLRKPGDPDHRLLALDVLDIEDGEIVEITTFSFEGLAEAFALPSSLP